MPPTNSTKPNQDFSLPAISSPLRLILAECSKAMSLPQATPALGPAPIRPLQTPASATNLETAQNAQDSIPPLQPVSSSSANGRTGFIEPLQATNADQTHRSVVWGVASTSSMHGLVPSLSSIPAPLPLSASSETGGFRPAVEVTPPSSSMTQSAAVPTVMAPSSSSISASSEQPVITPLISEVATSSAPVTSQIVSITPNATVYGTYNPSDYYANIATSSFPGSADASDTAIEANDGKASPKTAIIVVGSLAGALFLLMFVLLTFVRHRDKRKMSAGTRELLEPTYGATISANPDRRAAHRRPPKLESPVDRSKRRQSLV